MGILASGRAPVSPAPASVADAPATVVLLLSSVPDGAKLFFDDKPLVENPARKEVLADDKMHHVRAEAPGFASTSVDVRADAAKEVVLTLRRLSGRSGPASPAPNDPPPAKPDPTPPAPATTQPAEPKNARDRIRDLDTSNPWGK
jgi:hypothetical protein